MSILIPINVKLTITKSSICKSELFRLDFKFIYLFSYPLCKELLKGKLICATIVCPFKRFCPCFVVGVNIFDNLIHELFF
jgi:hypothetical protein